MSRINTQDGRLFRGDGTFSAQRTFLAQEQRFSPANANNGLSDLVSALGGFVVETQSKENEKRQKAEEALYNQTVSDLLDARDVLDNTPLEDQDSYKDAMNQYMERLAVAYETFPEDSGRGVNIRNQFASDRDIQTQFQNRQIEYDTARRGVYWTSLDEIKETYRTTEALSEYAQYSTYEARDLIYADLVQLWDPEIYGDFTPDVQQRLLKESLAIANFSKERRTTRIEQDEARITRDALGEVTSKMLSGDLNTDTLDAIVRSSSLPRTEILQTAASQIETRIDNLIEVGTDPQELFNLIESSRKFIEYAQDEEVAQSLNQVFKNYADLSGEQDTQALSVAAQDLFEDGADPAMIMSGADTDAVSLFHARFGHGVEADSVADIVPRNNVEREYLSTIQKGIEGLSKELQDSVGMVQKFTETLTNPDQASSTAVRDIVTASEDERIRLLKTFSDFLTQQDRDILVSDNAAWSAFVSDSFVDSDGWGEGFKMFVSDNLSTDRPSHQGLREALAYTGPDLSEHAQRFDDPRVLYALSETQRAVTNSEVTGQPVQDLTQAYQRGLAEYDSVRFNDGGEGDKTLYSYMDSPKFRKAFLGDKEARLSDLDKRKIVTLFDLQTVSDNDPDAVAPQIKQRLASAGLSVSQIRLNQSRSTGRLAYSVNSPESVGLDKSLVWRGMDQGNTRANRYIGSLLSYQNGLEPNNSLHDIALNQIKNNTQLVPNDLRGLLTKQEFQKVVDQGRVFFDVLSDQATETSGAPVVAYLTDTNGSVTTSLVLGSVNFNDPILIGSSPSFWKSDITARETSTIRTGQQRYYGYLTYFD